MIKNKNDGKVVKKVTFQNVEPESSISVSEVFSRGIKVSPDGQNCLTNIYVFDEDGHKYYPLLFIIILLSILVLKLTAIPERPALELDSWWGPNSTRNNQDTSIRPYRIVFTESGHQELVKKFEQHRVRNHIRSFNQSHHTYGFNSIVLDEVFDFWRFQYNVKSREKYFNKFNHFLTNIEGLDIHFVRVKPDVAENVKIYPILLLHGWPGSFRDFYEVIPILAAQQPGYDFVFEVIVPSLPGFGYSQASIKPGLSTYRTAVILNKLMQRVGFDKFYIQGGDIGHEIASYIATVWPSKVLGFHTNTPVNFSFGSAFVWVIGAIWPGAIVDDKYANRLYPLSDRISFLLEESGYLHMHMTKPDTLGVSLQDSPLGLAAYILEKYIIFSDPSSKHRTEGSLERYSMTDLIDNLVVYWFTGSITTSMRLYAESLSDDIGNIWNRIPTSVPTWGLRSKHELFHQPDFIIKWKYTDFCGSTYLDEGGHYAAMETPQLLANDIFKAVNVFRKKYK